MYNIIQEYCVFNSTQTLNLPHIASVNLTSWVCLVNPTACFNYNKNESGYWADVGRIYHTTDDYYVSFYGM